MATRPPIVLVGGKPKVLPAGDTVRGVLGGVQVTFDGGGGAIAVGSSASVRLPYGLVISRATMLGDVSGSMTVDVQVDTLAAYPPTTGDSIVASNPPRLASQSASEDVTLTGWTTTIAAGAVVRFQVLSNTIVGRLTLILDGVRT